MKLPLIISTILISAVLTSCKEKGPKAACGCDGPTLRRFQKLTAAYLGNGCFYILKEQEGRSSPDQNTAIITCNIDSSWVISPSHTIANYTISGDVKVHCPDDFSRLWAGYQPVTITNIEANP